MEIQNNIALAPYTTLGIGGPARFFCTINTEADIPAALHYAVKNHLSTFILGGGSNLLISDEYYEGLVLHMAIPGVTVTPHGSKILYDAAAGESWDALVSRAVADNASGIECLAGIPGTVGGTPVQNVGAYGQEVSETIASVRVFDTESESFTDLTPQQCGFRYRQSIFNGTERNRYIVTRVRFALTQDGPPRLAYADLQKHFANATTPPTLAETAAAVREIRRSKGMLLVPGDPDCRSAGSFFKNPIVDAAILPKLAQILSIDAEKIPRYPAAEGKIKLPAAWLLEQAGFHKGFALGPAAISSRHTLALINKGDANGSATAADIIALRNQIQHTIQTNFGIALHQEPVELGR